MSHDLKPWYAIATPHEDIREGRLEESVFAANLWAAVQGTAPEVYCEPEQFFSKTFMTTGLQAVLKRVASALSAKADRGDRIISLQTSFGGGKTHTLLALWHLAKHAEMLSKSKAGAALRERLGKVYPEKSCRVAVFTNATCDATQGRAAGDGVHTRTLWGELAFQLGGKELYELVRPNDEAQRVPQGLFVEVLQKASPCLILLDELADYCIGAAGVPVGETNLADQTISFIQQLEEAVAQVPGAAVVATLPASKMEVAQSEKGQEIFSSLEKRFQRLGADMKPVADHEIYQVVRTRLFEKIAEDPEYIKEVADRYVGLYGSHGNEVPPESTKPAYRELIEQSFPFHPSLIDTFYTRWGSHPDFQRTRGVLRLLAAIVGDLWKRRSGNTQTQHLIQPCHIRWSVDSLQASLIRLWGANYQTVIAADILGERSNATLIDETRGGDYTREAIGSGVAATILLASFGGQAQRSGFSGKDVKMTCARVGLNWNYTDGALLELENNSFFLQSVAAGSAGKRYWYGVKPTLNKLLVQYRQQFSKEPFNGEIIEALKSSTEGNPGAGASWRVVVNPGADLPEQKTLTLLMLAPSDAWNGDEASNKPVADRIREISTKCGSRERQYRNTLIFLAPSSRGLGKLRQAYRDLEALRAIRRDYGDQLDQEQRDNLKSKLDASAKQVQETLAAAWSVAFRASGNDMDIYQMPDSRPSTSDHLGLLWKSLVEDQEWILRKVGSVTLERAGLIPKSGEAPIRLSDAVESFLRYTDKDIVSSKDSVAAGFAQACLDGLLGIARGSSPTQIHARYCRKHTNLDPTEEGVWVIPAFEEETPESKKDDSKNGNATDSGTGAVDPKADGGTPEVSVSSDLKSIRISGKVPLENYSELFRCFISPAAKMDLKSLQIGVDFVMTASDSVPIKADDQRIKSMREAAKQLGLNFDPQG